MNARRAEPAEGRLIGRDVPGKITGARFDRFVDRNGFDCGPAQSRAGNEVAPLLNQGLGPLLPVGNFMQ
jgi:hypothetical protein